MKITQEQAKMIADYLRYQFEWIENPDEDVDCADQIETLAMCYQSLRAYQKGE